MGPPKGPPMGPRLRPRSQAGPARFIPAQFVRRSQTARPISTFINGGPTQGPPRLGTAVLIRRRIRPQEPRYRPSPPAGPQDPRGFFTPDGSSQTQWLPSRDPGIRGVGDRIPSYGRAVRRATMASHAPSSRPMQHNGRETPPSSRQLETEIDHVSDGPYRDRFDGQPADQTGQASSSARHTMSTRASPFEEHPSSRPPFGRPSSRSPSISECGAPVNIQVLGPPNELSYSDSRPKIRWEFILHLLPSTKMWELCLHAASYVRREYHSTVDGMALAAGSRNGTIFEDQSSLSEVMLQGGTLFLIERRLVGTVQPVPANFGRESMDLAHLERTSQAGNLNRPYSAYSRDLSQAIDDADQVPAPRQLPFPLIAAPGLPRSSSTVAPQSPLAERPDLMNRSIRTRASNQLQQPIGQNISAKAAAKKKPSGRQKRPPTASKRPASTAGGSKFDSTSATTEPSEPRIPTSRPKPAQGISRKRKAPSSDETVSAATPSVIESAPSGAEVSEQEMAKTPCMGCRNKKRKCNRLKPACGQCLKDNRPCTYPNLQETATTGSIADKASKGHGLEIVNHPMVLRSKAVISLPVMSDASTQTSHSRPSRHIATQTQGAEPDKIEVDMKDVGTDPYNLYTDASMETEGCNDIWLPFSQAAEVVVWACRRSEEHRSKPAEIFKITDPSHEDYRSQVEQAAVYAAKFEKELREKCEQVLKK